MKSLLRNLIFIFFVFSFFKGSVSFIFAADCAYVVPGYGVVYYNCDECVARAGCTVNTVRYCATHGAGNCISSCGSETYTNCCGETSTSDWSKYKSTCETQATGYLAIRDDFGGITGYNVVTACVQGWTKFDSMYSTGDKCVSPGENGLRAGNCDGSYKSYIYKYCCSAAGPAENCIQTDEDGHTPPYEGTCPGGWKINGGRVKSSPCCTSQDGDWGGWSGCSSSCGQSESRSCDNPSPSCGGSSCSGSSTQSCGTSDTGSPSTPTIISPKGSSSSPTIYATGNNLGFSWNGVSGAELYHVQVVNSSGQAVYDNEVYGTNLTQTISGTGTFYWHVQAINNTCESIGVGTRYSSGWSSNGYFTLDTPPTPLSGTNGFDIQNINGSSVTAESGRNHICQSTFVNTTSSTTARFKVTYTDAQGGSDINSIQIKFGSTTFTDYSLDINGNNATAVFDISTSQISSISLQDVSTFAVDNHDASGVRGSWNDTNRDFKFWNCKVAASGAGYDGSETTGVCSDSGSFAKKIPSSLSYSLLMNDVSSFNEDKTMTVSSPDYSTSSNLLNWGRDYIFTVSNLAGTKPVKIRLNGSTCSSLQFNINNAVADPYSNSVSFVADFSSILDQDPWWQANNGGVISNNKIIGQVPVTCVTNNCKIGLNSLVTAPIIDKTGRSVSNSQSWFYQNSLSKLVDVNKNYSYFFDQYFVKNGIGTTLIGNKTITNLSDLGSDTNNIYFINGNLNINGNIGNIDNFLMIIVSGNVVVSPAVTEVDGIFVTDNISVGGTSSDQLIFNGSLFASDNIDFSRGYTIKSTNNSTPAVVVKYNPGLMFKLPGKVAKVLTNWQW